MAELSQAARNYLADMASQPGARAPATFSEIWESEWKRTGLDTVEGVGKPLVDAREQLKSAIEGATGKSIVDYAADRGIQLNPGGFDRHIKALNDLADTLPVETKSHIDPLRDVRRNAVTVAQKMERDAADIESRTYGLSGTAVAWAAGISRQTVSPANLAMMAITAPIGGPVSAGAAKFVAGQALAGVAAQAAVEPLIQPGRAELGLESGVGRAIGNIAEVGLGSAALAGAGVGLHRLFRAAADSYRGLPAEQPPVEAPAATPLGEAPTAPVRPPVEPVLEAERHPNLVPEDFEAAAFHAERDAVTTPPDADPVIHSQSVYEAEQILETGRPPADDIVGAMLGQEPRLAPLNEELSGVLGQIRAALAVGDEARVAELRAQGEAMIARFDQEVLRGPPGQTELPLPIARSAAPVPPIAREAPEPDIIGDPALARDVETRLAALPDADKVVFQIEQPDKTLKSGTAKTFLREIEDDAKAVKELIDCIGKDPT
jgi:hypothetical protein